MDSVISRIIDEGRQQKRKNSRKVRFDLSKNLIISSYEEEKRMEEKERQNSGDGDGDDEDEEMYESDISFDSDEEDWINTVEDPSSFQTVFGVKRYVETSIETR